MIFEKFQSFLPKQKSKQELKKRYDEIELERGDLLAMFIAALVTFGPLIVIITLVYICVAIFFGL